MSEIPEDEINTESESDASIKQIEEKYYLKPSPSKQSSFYITKQQHNDGYERGQLQYKIEPKLLKKVITDNIENDEWIIDENIEENLKRLVPKTSMGGIPSEWELILVMKNNNNKSLKGALRNKKTGLIALMTSKNIDGNRYMNSHDSNWFIGHYRMRADKKFWYELIRILNSVKIKCIMRNNQWGKHQKLFDTIRFTQKIVAPWGHWKDTNKLFEEGKFNNEKYSNIFINDLKINDLVCMFDRQYKYALILKIKSDPITEKVKDIIIIRNNKCSHRPLTHKCKTCSDSVELVCSTKYFEENSKDFIKYLTEDYQFENMYAIIRKIEIVGIIDESCDVYNICKKLQSSICRSNKQILETDIFDDNKSDEYIYDEIEELYTE